MRNIREAQETDFEKIRTLVSSSLRECATSHPEHYDNLYQDVCHSLEEGLENKNASVFLVSEAGDSILGVVLVKDYWNVSVLFVDPQHQGLGVGRDLMAAVIHRCKGWSPKGCLKPD